MYRPHKAQIKAHNAILVDGYKRAVLMMGRQCFAAGTPVATDGGYTNIEDLQIGDSVLTSNGYKKVTNTWHYGVDTDPKPMLSFKIDEETIRCTYDHKFHYNGQYVPFYKLAWGALAASQRAQLKLLCEQYGQAFDDQPIWGEGQDSGDEASKGQIWLSTYSPGRQNSEGPQSDSSDLARKPSKQGNSESYRQRQDEQQDNQSGVGDTKREHSSLSQAGQSSQQAGGELRNSYIKGTSSSGDTSVAREAIQQRDSQEIRCIVLHGVRHNETQYLVPHIEVEPTCDTYAIEVESPSNYCVSKKNILVSNSGKTFFATQHAWLSAVLEQGRYFVVFKTYKQAHEVVWRQYVPLIPQELIYKKNEQDLLIELNYVKGPVTMPNGDVVEIEHDTTKPRSTIQLLGSDQADTHRGFKANGIIFDEYADQSPNNWDAVYKHFFTTTDGWAIFMGTPRGYNHFYDLVMYAQDDDRWYYQEATWRDSPYVKKEFIEQEKAEAVKKGTLSTFLQEVELEFRSVQGAVYPVFSRKVHVIKPNKIPDDLTYYAGIDFGYHTTAFLLVGIDREQNWYVIDEVYGKQETLNDVIPRIRNKIGDKRLVLLVADSNNRDAIEVMRKDFPIVGVNKSGGAETITTGIQLIRQKLQPRTQLIGSPKPELFVGSNCKNFIVEMESYKYPEDKEDRNPSELPVKLNDHGPDALRYLMLHLKYGIQTEDELPKPSMQFNSYGLI